jgi:hypothetical protein
MLTDKQMKKVKDILGQDMIADLDKMDVDTLGSHLYIAEHSIMEARRELDANPKFQELKDSLSALSAGMREVKKRQTAIIHYIVSLLEEKGK